VSQTARADSAWVEFAIRVTRPTAARVGLALLALVVFPVAAAPLIAPYPQDAGAVSHLANSLQPPSPEHLLGTDELGRDVLTRLLFGGQISLMIGLASMVLTTVAGTALGLLAGYGSPSVDQLVMRIADVFLGTPALVLAILVTLTLGGGPEMIVLAIGIANWPRVCRVVRSEVLRLKMLEFVVAAKAYGASPVRVAVRHLLPGTIPVLLAQATLLAGAAILTGAALSFIGIGARPPSPEWGLAIAIGRQYLPESWWISFFPGAIIMTTVIALNLVGDAIRGALGSSM